MKVAAVALLLVILAVVVLWFGDNLYSGGSGGLFGNQAPLVILLLSIPISLALFFILSLRQRESDSQHRQEDDSSQ